MYLYTATSGDESSRVSDLRQGNRVDSAFPFPYKSRRSLGPSSSSQDRVLFQIADRPQIRLGAFPLVYKRSLEAGLIEPNPFQLRVTPYHLQPTTAVFVGLQRDAVVCTVSLSGDGDVGLTLERVYSKEVERKRAEDLSLAEVSCLAFQEAAS